MKKNQITKTKHEVPIQREKRYFTVEARKAIVDEIDAGLSKSEAARRYGTSQTTIYNWVRNHFRSVCRKCDLNDKKKIANIYP